MNKSRLIKMREQFFIIFLLLMTIEYVLAYYNYQNNKLAWTARTSIILVFCCICLIPTFAKKRYKLNYTFFLTLVFTFCLIWSLFKMVTEPLIWGVLDGTCMFALVGGIWLSRFSLDLFEKLFRIISVIGIVRLLYILITGKINWGFVLTRQLTWTAIFYWSCVFWAIIPGVLLAVIRKRNYWLVLVYWLCGFINELLFLKRYIIADSILLAAMVIFILYKQNVLSINTLYKLVSVFILVGIAIYIISRNQNFLSAFNGVIARFQGVSVENLDRIRESENYFNNVGIADVLLGKGFWSAHNSLLNINPALHVGWANFIFKGGIPCFLVVLIPVIKAYKKVWHLEKYTEESQLAIAYVIIMSIRLLLLNAFSFQPELLFLSWGCITVMDRLEMKDNY